jgi:TRAP-type mannitol/chloroaromatic compound transport system permease small subunit
VISVRGGLIQSCPAFSFLGINIMNLLVTISRWIDAINEYVGRGVAWVTALLVVVIFIDVIMRYTLNMSFVFVQELEWHLFGFIFLIGAGYTLLHDGHVRVDIVYQRLGFKGRAWVNFIGVLIFLIPGCWMVISTSLKFVMNSYSLLEGSPDPGGIPFRFIIKGCIPVGFTLLLLQGLSMGIHSFLQIIGLETAKEEES